MATLLYHLRIAAGITTTDLVARLGVSHGTISNLENGSFERVCNNTCRNPSIRLRHKQIVAKLERFFGLSLETLLTPVDREMLLAGLAQREEKAA